MLYMMFAAYTASFENLLSHRKAIILTVKHLPLLLMLGLIWAVFDQMLFHVLHLIFNFLDLEYSPAVSPDATKEESSKILALVMFWCTYFSAHALISLLNSISAILAMQKDLTVWASAAMSFNLIKHNILSFMAFSVSFGVMFTFLFSIAFALTNSLAGTQALGPLYMVNWIFCGKIARMIKHIDLKEYTLSLT